MDRRFKGKYRRLRGQSGNQGERVEELHLEIKLVDEEALFTAVGDDRDILSKSQL